MHTNLDITNQQIQSRTRSAFLHTAKFSCPILFSALVNIIIILVTTEVQNFIAITLVYQIFYSFEYVE